MSDTDFDKEAEREQLREQLRREEEARRSTQHMSELLLKGATMTNRHCDTCGDPLFRYEGREFCPTCAQEEGADAGEAAASGGAVDRVDGPEATAPGVDRVGGDATGEDAAAPDVGATAQDVGSTAPAADEGARPAATGDLGAARASLERTLASLARRAEETEDVGRTRELLAAAREAAEALAALDGGR